MRTRATRCLPPPDRRSRWRAATHRPVSRCSRRSAPPAISWRPSIRSSSGRASRACCTTPPIPTSSTDSPRRRRTSPRSCRTATRAAWARCPTPPRTACRRRTSPTWSHSSTHKNDKIERTMAVAAVHPGGIADHIHPEPQGFVRRYVFSLDHKIIGIQYLITAFVFFMLAGLLAEAIRTQLYNANGGFIAPDTYNEVYSVHGSAMVWLVIIPLLTGGFGNLVFPIQIGARDVAFPWLNMLSFWIFPVTGIILYSSFLFGAPSAGWTEYPPIST